MAEVIRHTSMYSRSTMLHSITYDSSSGIFTPSFYPTVSQVSVNNDESAVLASIDGTTNAFKDQQDEIRSKRIHRRERNRRREKIPEGTLCVVCADLASGIHYSVASCNGCKTFFRRALVNKQAFQCQFSDDCIVDKSVRCGCRSCRLKKCFEKGMDPKAIQHDRDKIRYTKRGKKIKQEETVELIEYLPEKSSFIKKEIEDSPSSIQTEDLNNLYSPSSSAGHGPGSSGISVDHEFQDIQEKRLQSEMSNILSILLKLEQKIAIIRSANRFTVHTSVASCMYDRRLLEDEIWISTHSTPMPHLFNPCPCDRDNMRDWFVKDLTLMIEWAKCLPQMEQLLLNDKLALIKAFAPMFPLIQLVYFSYSLKKNNIATSSQEEGSEFLSTVKSELRQSYADPLNFILSDDFKRLFSEEDKLWYPDGQYLERDDGQSRFPASNKKQVFLNPLLIDGVYRLMQSLNLSDNHFVLYKLMLFFNPYADGLSSIGKTVIYNERLKALNYLFAQFKQDRINRSAAEHYADVLLMTATLMRVASFVKRTFDISHIFRSANASNEDLIDQLIIVGL